MHEVRPVGLENNQIVVSVLFKNSGAHLVKEMDFSVSDSSNVKLMKSVSFFNRKYFLRYVVNSALI